MVTAFGEPSAPTFVGRTEELGRIHAVAETARTWGGQLILLSGEAGIGKSTLVRAALAQLAEQGWDTHIGNCVEFGHRPLPFGPIVSILRSVLRADPGSADALVAHLRTDLAGLLPELRADDARAPSLDGDVDRVFDGITSVLVNAAIRRPVMVVVEDIHWADSAMRDLLAWLVHGLGSAPVLLLATERTDAVERSHPLRTWMAEQRRFPNVHSLVLGGLSRGHLREQATALLGVDPEASFVAELHERTAGNPYFSAELLAARRAGSDVIPATLVEFLTSRLARLAPPERETLRALAIAGGAARHAMLASMLPHVDLPTVLRSLFDAAILEIRDDQYAFHHALLREAILGDVLPFEAEALHRAAAEAIVDDPRRGASLADQVSLALHWAAAGEPDRCLVAAALAARAAGAVAAYETAADMSRQALDVWTSATEPEELAGMERDEMLLASADSLSACGHTEAAADLVVQARATWAAALDRGRRALIAARLSMLRYQLADPAESTRLLDEAIALAGNEVSPEAAQVHNRVSKQAIAEGQIHPALDAAERAIAISSEVGPVEVQVDALITKGLAVGVTDDLEPAMKLIHEARQKAMEEGLVSQVAQSYRTEMLLIVIRDGRTDASLDAVRAGLAYAEAHCGPRWRDHFLVDLFLGLVEAGYLNEAEPMVDELIDKNLDEFHRVTVLQTSALLALGQGRLDRAAEVLQAVDAVAGRFASAQETGYQARLLAEVARRQGRLDDAIEAIDRAVELHAGSDNVTYLRDSLIESIRLARTCRQRRHPAHESRLRKAAEDLERFDAVGDGNEAMRDLMEVELAAANGNFDIDQATSVVDSLEAAGFRVEAAQARLLLVEEIIRTRADRSLLVEELRALHEIAATHGMRWIEERAQSIAKGVRVDLGAGTNSRTGSDEPVEPAAEGGAARFALTDREAEVLALVAEGLTNKAIGERLFVSPRTVSTHVSNLLAKLGLHSRGEAAAAYHRLGADTVIDLRDPVDMQALRDDS